MTELSANARLILQIGQLLSDHHLSELDLGDLDDLETPTYILHSDNDGDISDDPVTKVFWDGHELSVEVDATRYNETQRVYQDEFDTNTDALEGIRDNVVEVLERLGFKVANPQNDALSTL